MITIYLLRNKITGDSYVGQTNNLKRRLSNHKTDSCNKNTRNYNTYIGKNIREFGWDNIEKIVIGSTNDQDNADVLEEYYRKYYKCNLNIRTGGKFGYKHSEETKQKLKEINNGENGSAYGLYGADSNNFKGGSVYQLDCRWRFQYYHNNKKRTKDFSINKFGHNRALELALLAKEEWSIMNMSLNLFN